MSSENIGDLVFGIRADRNGWRTDLQELDRMQQEYRQKWEKPVAMNAAAGAAAGMGGSRVSGGSGPNIFGTSNGDVTWRGPGGTGFYGGGGSRGGSGGSRRAMFEEMGMDYDEMKEMKRQADHDVRVNRIRAGQAKQNEIDYARMQNRQEQQAGSEFDRLRQEDSDKTPLLQRKIPLRTMLRYTMAGLVVDTLAAELASQENYSKAIRLAGIDQGAQSEATIGRFKDSIGGIPLIGGVLNNLFSPLTTPIETQNELTRRQMQFQDQSAAIRMSVYATNSQAGQALASPIGFSRSAMGIAAQREAARARTSDLVDELRKNAGFEDTSGNKIGASDMARYGVMNAIIPGAGLYAAWKDSRGQVTPEKESANRERSRFISATGARLNAADDKLAKSQQEALDWQGSYSVAMSQATTERMAQANNWRPTFGSSRATVMEARATASYLGRPAPDGYSATADRSKLTPEGKAFRDENGLLVEGLKQSREGLKSQVTDLNMNYLMGSGKEYNPVTQSADAFTDRSPETQSDKMDALTDAIKELTSIIQKQVP